MAVAILSGKNVLIYYFVIIFLEILLAPAPFPREGFLLVKLLKFLNLDSENQPLGDSTVLSIVSHLSQYLFSPSTLLTETLFSQGTHSPTQTPLPLAVPFDPTLIEIH